jgi:spermidine synthase
MGAHLPATASLRSVLEIAMNRMILLDTARIPNDGGELRLFQEGEHFSIKIAGGGDLMSTRMHGSEDALARIACERIAGRAQPRVLIGGLGMGFTLAAALGHLGANAQVVVAELVPEVVKWNRGPLGEHAGNPLLDKRVVVREVDVAGILKAERQAFDAILLDVDNGPGGLTHKNNDWLYALQGLAASLAALRPNGLLAIWSAHSDRKFTERLRQAGFTVEEVPVRAHGNKGARHMIWLGMKAPLKPATKSSGVRKSVRLR